MKPRVTKKDVQIAAKVLSPSAAKLLAKHRTKSRGMQTYFRKDKPIETVKVIIPLLPSHSGADYFMTVSLPRIKFLEQA